MRKLLPGWVHWPQLDIPLLVALLLLMSFGLVVLYSASGGSLDTVYR
jgi:rod shape determining protein RodA